MEEGPPTKYNLVCKSKKHRTSNIVHDASTAKWNKKEKKSLRSIVKMVAKMQIFINQIHFLLKY